MPVEAQSKEYRGIEYRLLPGSRSRAGKLAGIAGACRFVWNVMLAQLNEEYKDKEKKNPSISFFSLGKRFTALRRRVHWLPKYSFSVVRYTLKYQADAWQAFFEGERDRPRFKSRHRITPSFTIPENVKIKDGKLFVPKVGWMQMRRNGGNPYPDGKPVEATVKKVGRKWRVSVTYEIDPQEKTDNGIAVGVDLNTYNVAWTDTDRERGMLEIPKLTKSEIRIKRYQRKLARQQKGSQRRRVTKRKIAKWKRKQKNQRMNRDHQNSRALASRAETLVREDLNITRMSKSAKGTKENPGKNVRQKAGLNRVIRESSWGRFNRYCDYKFKKVLKVDPKYTSQRCSVCGYTCKDNRKTQNTFKCMACGHADHADYNASANILASGIGAAGRREAFSLETSMTRQIGTTVAA